MYQGRKIHREGRRNQKINDIFESEFALPIYKLRQILLPIQKPSSASLLRRQKMVNLMLLLDNQNNANLEFFVTNGSKDNSNKLYFHSSQTLPSTVEFQGVVPLQ